MAALLLSLGFFLPLASAGKKNADDDDEPKDGLHALQEFIGNWKGTADAKNKGFWQEKVSWSWRFKGKESWLSFELEKSKLHQGGEVRFLPDKSKYQLTLVDKAGKKSVFDGVMKKSVLVVERLNPDSKDTEQLKLFLTGGGDRFIYEMWIKPDGRTMFNKQLTVACTKEGVTFGVDSAGKKPECVVTGGLGTMQVSHNGQTYYVCCSGCRDAFNENPAKIIAEYMKKKKK
jgi:ribosomal protein L24E